MESMRSRIVWNCNEVAYGIARSSYCAIIMRLDSIQLCEPITEQFEGYSVKHIIYSDATDMFSLDMITVESSAILIGDGCFYGIYILGGKGKMNGESIEKCDHFFIGAACKEITLENDGTEPLEFVRFYGSKS